MLYIRKNNYLYKYTKAKICIKPIFKILLGNLYYTNTTDYKIIIKFIKKLKTN